MEAAFGWRDYLFIAWTFATTLAGFYWLAHGVAHPGVDHPRRGDRATAAFLSLLPIAIFLVGMALAAGVMPTFVAKLGGGELLQKGLASLVGQALAAGTLLGCTFLIPGSVQWAPSAAAAGETPPSSDPLDGAAELRGAWRAFDARTWLKAYLALVALAAVAALLWKGFYFFCQLNGQALPEESQDIVRLVANYDWSGSWTPMAMMTLAIVVGAPIAEELTFRGMLYPSLKGWLPRGYAVVLTGLLFGIIHGNAAAFLPLMAFGCVLCLFRDRFGLLTCMGLHLLFNLLSFLWLCVAPHASTKL